LLAHRALNVGLACDYTAVFRVTFKPFQSKAAVKRLASFVRNSTRRFANSLKTARLYTIVPEK